MEQPKFVNFTEDTAKRIFDLTAQLLAKQLSEEMGVEITVTTELTPKAI